MFNRYHIIKYRVDYQDLGPDYFLGLEPERQKRYLVKRLEQLGYQSGPTHRKTSRIKPRPSASL